MPARPAAAPPSAADQQDDAADRQARQARGARIAADHARGEAEGGVEDQDVSERRKTTMPSTRPQWTSVPGMLPIMSASGSAIARRLVEARRIAHHAFDELVEHGDGDIGQQQGRDRLVDAAPMAQRARHGDPRRAGDHAGDRHDGLHDRAAAHGRRSADRSAIAATPPITNAPSPPMIINPACAGSAVHSAVRMSGADKVSVFWIENHEPTEPTSHLVDRRRAG